MIQAKKDVAPLTVVKYWSVVTCVVGLCDVLSLRGATAGHPHPHGSQSHLLLQSLARLWWTLNPQNGTSTRYIAWL